MRSVDANGSFGELGAGLSDAKRELLARRLRGARSTSADLEIPRRPAGENPMSFGQERIWFQSQVTGNPALFNIPFLAHIDGLFDFEALEASVNAIIARHENLRTGFRSLDGTSQQFILPAARLNIAQVDLTNAAGKALGQMRSHAQTEARVAFELASPPLMRVTLYKVAPSRHALLFVVHHIVWDGWSSGVFIEEIKRLYEAMTEGRPAALQPLTVQYSDFAYWQRQLMASETGARQIEYWRKRLASLPELISLPTDRPRVMRQSHVGGLHEWTIPAATLERLEQFARRLNVTQFVALLAAFNVLLLHYSGQQDIAIGAAMACRTRPALERLTGFFANMLVMRASLDDDPSFEELLRRTHETSVEAQSNQDAPFDLLVERIAPRRGLSHNPLFQVAYVQHHLPIEEMRIGDLRVNFENLNAGAAAFDLVFHVYAEAPGLRAAFEYDAHLFDARTIHAMARHFRVLLDHLLDNPRERISQARFLDARQEAQAVADSRAPLAPGRDGMLLHDLLDGAESNATAVVCGDERLTYRELTVRANQLAHYLRARGVGPDAPVALLIEPSLDMLVAILGILKADGAYAPLDPAYPRQRICDILADCGARTIVMTSAHVAAFAPVDIDVIRLDELASSLASYPSCPPAPRAREDNLAYLIYTSGSAGLSKGVMISHRSAVASTQARRQFYPENAPSFLLLSSVSFDSSVAGIFWTLAQGGVLHVTRESERRDPGALARLIVKSAISHLLCLPSLYDALLDVGDASTFSSLRSCIVAGEACRAELTERHFSTLPAAALINEYGPTECAVWSAAHRVSGADSAGSVPIGRPIPGAQTLVLGAGGALAPQGAAGEFWIGGAGLARGYANRADLTADRFRPNPFGAPGSRLYRTGDRARLNANGDIEFLGRLDEQLKIRGYRVDPREIESVLLQFANVTECVVAAKPSSGGAGRIVAYYRTAESSLDESALRRHARERLPSFMIPDVLFRLEDLPRLPNGKIDRNALPEPQPSRSSTPMGATEDATVMEIILADIWRDVLGASEVRASDNFFDLGGNSLAAIRVVARANQMFGRDIPASAIFESADLSSFAKKLESILGPDFEHEISALLARIEAEAVA